MAGAGEQSGLGIRSCLLGRSPVAPARSDPFSQSMRKNTSDLRSQQVGKKSRHIQLPKPERAFPPRTITICPTGSPLQLRRLLKSRYSIAHLELLLSTLSTPFSTIRNSPRCPSQLTRHHERLSCFLALLNEVPAAGCLRHEGRSGWLPSS